MAKSEMDVVLEVGELLKAGGFELEAQKWIKGASKQGTGRDGKPEFIADLSESTILLVECKKDHTKQKAAVREAVGYARAIKDKEVVCIAVSDIGKNQKVDTFHKDISGGIKDLEIHRLQKKEDYLKSIKPPLDKTQAYDALIRKAKELHDYLWTQAKLTQEQKPLLVSGVLIALLDGTYNHKTDNSRDRFRELDGEELAQETYDAIGRQLVKRKIGDEKTAAVKTAYQFITTHPILTKGKVLHDAAVLIDDAIYPFISENPEYDIVGHFYGEFLKYSAGDGKGLGIVLTPKHICELFVKLGGITKDSVLLDTACGTGGFLIAGMYEMIKLAGGDIEKHKEIKTKQLVGVEQQLHMYAMAASSMLIRGDGKTNLFFGSSFDDEITRKFKAKHPTLACINPPYGMGGDLSELKFMEHALDYLEPGGKLVAIAPVSCALSGNRKDILAKHTLEAVMTLPPDLFPKIGVLPAIFIFKAHTPHSGPTWMAKWTDDGFNTVMRKGRQDTKGTWQAIEAQWLKDFSHKVVRAGYSAFKEVGAEDAWLVDAYV